MVDLTKRAMAAALLSAVLVPRLARAADRSMAVDHTAKLKPVDQGNANLCWLAASAMMSSWRKGGASVTMAAQAALLGSPFRELYEQGQANPQLGGLPGTQVRSLAARLGLQADGMQSFVGDWWIDRITAGPMWVGGYPGSGTMAHVAVITGLAGETGKLLAMKVRYIDPAGGAVKSDTFGSLIKFYEGLARAGVPQLLYYA